MRNIPTECTKYRCSRPHYSMGLCEEHHIEKETKQNEEQLALEALHYFKVNDEYFKNQSLRDELFKIQKWWHKACLALNSNFTDDILQDEADAAANWCIALAKDLVKEEIRFRNGEASRPYELQSTQDWVWDRFKNLEKGLKSNGVARNT